MKYRTVLIFSEVFCLLIFFHFLDSGLSVLNDFDFKSSEKDGIENSLLSFTFFKTLRESSDCVSSVTQREHRRQRTLFLRCLLRLNSPSFYRTTRVILVSDGPVWET